MLWFFVALQAMTPLIHAHAGTVQPGSGYAGHAGSLHVRQCAHSDAACHAIAADEHGAEVEVAQGMPSRNDTRDTASDAPLAAALTLPRAAVTERPGAGLPAPPPLHLAPPDHTLPHALAPPSA